MKSKKGGKAAELRAVVCVCLCECVCKISLIIVTTLTSPQDNLTIFLHCHQVKKTQACNSCATRNFSCLFNLQSRLFFQF